MGSAWRWCSRVPWSSIPSPGGPASTIYTAPPGVTITRVLIWTPDGRQILARIREPDGRLTLVGIPPAGGPAQIRVRPTDVSRAGARWDWWSDGRRLWFTIARYEGDVWTARIE